MWVAAAISPSATSPADTEPRNIVARPVDSAIVAARAPWRVKCSVVTNVTAAGRGSVPSSGAGFASLIIAHHLARDGYGAIIAGKHQRRAGGAMQLPRMRSHRERPAGQMAGGISWT